MTFKRGKYVQSCKNILEFHQLDIFESDKALEGPTAEGVNVVPKLTFVVEDSEETILLRKKVSFYKKLMFHEP